jgi:hypothetical protein
MPSSCDERCTKASGSSCDCQCGGQNHGAFSSGGSGELHAIDRSEAENVLTMTRKELNRELNLLHAQRGRLDKVDSAQREKEEISIIKRKAEIENEIARRELGGPEIGSVSTGTLKSGDLLNSFRSALEDYDAKSYREHLEEFPDLDDVYDEENEDVAEAIQDLEDRLNDVAPDGAYFGSHPGDGADFGFWLADEE